MASVFMTLTAINVNGKTEKKNGLTYLSWAWAWGEVKRNFPDATFTIYERETDFGPVNYFTDGKTCWVKTGLTINGLEHIEELPVMDFRNNAIPFDKITSTDVNKAIQRSLTKAAARHGLGLYIYAGEDLPEAEIEEAKFTRPDVNETQKKAEEPSVTAVEKIPPVKSKVVPMKKPEKNDVLDFLTAAMISMREQRGITPQENNKIFKAQFEALVNAKLAPNKKIEEYTMEEAEALIDAMYKCFKSTKGTELKTE